MLKNIQIYCACLRVFLATRCRCELRKKVGYLSLKIQENKETKRFLTQKRKILMVMAGMAIPLW